MFNFNRGKALKGGKMMKKGLFLVLASIGFAMVSMADVLNWQIASTGSEDFNFDTVKVFYSESGTADSNSTPLSFYDSANPTTQATEYSFGATRNSLDLADGLTFQSYLPANYESAVAWNFYVEFIDSSSTTRTGWSNFSYSNLETLKNYVASSWNTTPSPAPVTAVPEPTSGLLLLMGGALLALRRKRA